jgi:hypothetical protein
VLLHDLFAVLQGLPGRVLAPDAAPARGWGVRPEAGVALAQRLTLRHTAELGVLYSQVAAFARGGGVDSAAAAAGGAGAGSYWGADASADGPGGSGSSASGSGRGGLIRQALCEALSEELDVYVAALTALQAQLPPLPDAASGAAAAARSEGGDFPQTLTLRRVWAWAQEPLARLRALAAVVDAVAGATGGPLLTVLYLACQGDGHHGDASARVVAARLLTKATRPLLAMAQHWLSTGAILDPHGEFFIVALPSQAAAASPVQQQHQQHQQQTGAGALWRLRFAIDPARVPSFVSWPLVQALLLAGKTVVFIREACAHRAFSLVCRLSHCEVVAAAADAACAAADAADAALDPCSGAAFATRLGLDTASGAGLGSGFGAGSSYGSGSLSAGAGVHADASGGWDGVFAVQASPQPLTAAAALAAAGFTGVQPPPCASSSGSSSRSSGYSSSLEAVAYRAAAAASTQLMYLLDTQFAMRRHFTALQEMVLLGSGEFARALLDCAAPELGRHAATIAPHQMQAVVDAALLRLGQRAGGAAGTGGAATGGAAGADADTHGRVLARLVRGGEGDRAWDVFTLDYALGDSPLSAVVDAPARARYMRVFRLLWKVKRAEAELAQVWALHSGAVARIRLLRDGATTALVRRCELVRHELLHFAAAMSSYLAHEVLGAAASGWRAALDGGVQSFDGLIAAHGRFLQTLSTSALLEGPGAAAVLAYLNRLLDIGVQYRYLQDRAFDAILLEAARREQRDLALFAPSTTQPGDSAAVAASVAAATAAASRSVGGATAARTRARVAVTRLRTQLASAQRPGSAAGAASPTAANGGAAPLPAAVAAAARRLLRCDGVERAARAAYADKLAVVTKQVLTVQHAHERMLAGFVAALEAHRHQLLHHERAREHGPAQGAAGAAAVGAEAAGAAAAEALQRLRQRLSALGAAPTSAVGSGVPLALAVTARAAVTAARSRPEGVTDLDLGALRAAQAADADADVEAAYGYAGGNTIARCAELANQAGEVTAGVGNSSTDVPAAVAAGAAANIAFLSFRVDFNNYYASNGKLGPAGAR